MCGVVLSSITQSSQTAEGKEVKCGEPAAGDQQEVRHSGHDHGLDWLEGTHGNVTYLLLPSPQDSTTSSKIETKLSSYFENRPLFATPSSTPPLPPPH
jgi:hypothetical protein